MTSEIVIESGVAIPPVHRSGAFEILDKLEVGQSVVLAVASGLAMRAASYRRIRDGKKFVCRTVGQDLVRIWRVA
jgi:hypothetical protein